MPFTLTVNGVNFTSSTVVVWNGTDLTTTQVSSTELQAQIPASLIAVPNTVTVSVTPAETINYVATFTITPTPLAGNTVTAVDIQANDMVWDPVSQQIYLSVSSSNGANGDTITALNPSTGQLGISQNAGGEPDMLALASDGSYLYAGINGSASVQRFTLPGLGMDINIPLGASSIFGPYYAMDVEAAPGSPHTIAVVRGNTGVYPVEQCGVVIYDDAVARPTSVPRYPNGPIDSIQWNGNATQIYGENNEDSGFDFYVMSVNSSGVQITNDYRGVFNMFNAKLHYDATTGYVYNDGGQAVNPATGTVVGAFPTNTIQGGFVSGGVMVPDGTLNIAYFLGKPFGNNTSGEYLLEAFNLTNFTFIDAVPIPNVVGFPLKLIRWGTNGLAFLTGSDTGSPLPGTGVYIISGTFVTNP